jgi:PAS domain S-box-containing protein
MIPEPSAAEEGAGELELLVQRFAEAEANLQAHLAGQADTIVGLDGQAFMLHPAQQRLLASEAALIRQAGVLKAILDALPSHIALVDAHGVITAVNLAWTRFAQDNGWRGASYGIGSSYLEVCATAILHGQDAVAADARAVVNGLTRVLGGEIGQFSYEYACHAPTAMHWYVLTITPLCSDDSSGAVIAHADITERKLAELSLQASEDRFRATFEQAAVGIAHVAVDGRFLRVNVRFCDIVGYSRDEILGLSFTHLSFPEDQEVADAARHAMLARTQASYAVEKRYRRKDGVAVWISLVTTMVHSPADKSYFLTVIEDITLRKDAERLLRDSERRFRAVIERSADGISLIDADNRILYLSPAVAAIEGYAPDELVGRLGLENTHPDDLEAVRRTIVELLAHPGKPIACVWRRRHKEGHWLWLEGVAINLLGDPAVGAIVTNYHDVTGRRRAEAEIRQTQQLMRMACRVGRMGAWSVDVPTLTVTWSEEIKTIHDLPLDFVPDITTAIEFYAPEYRPAITAAVDACRLEGVPFDMEVQIITATGRSVWAHTIGEAVRNAEGAIVSVQGAFQDITERRKLEHQFLRAQRLEGIGTLAGGIAHDLNNVLTPILLAINLLSRGERDEKRLRMLEMMDASAKRGADMVKQVLSFARGVEGQRLPVLILELLREIEKFINETFLKSIRVRTQVAADIWYVVGDHTQLYQLLLNLCVNARDAMPDGGSITLSAENVTLDEVTAKVFVEAKPGSYVVIGVEDTGSGMTPEIIAKIFEPFFTTKDIGHGTGLGLSTCLAVVKSHGGFIRVYSEPQKGTSFKIYLPAQIIVQADPQRPAEEMLPRGHGELILVVDDEAAIRQLARQTLEAFGYRVLVASDGSEALAIFAVQQDSISVVLTDIMMPVMDGLSLIRVMLKIRPGVRIIAASGLNESHLVSKAMSGGVKHFLAKPFSPETLLGALATVIAEPEGASHRPFA